MLNRGARKVFITLLSIQASLLGATISRASDPPAGNGRILGAILESQELAAVTHRFYPTQEPIYEEYVKPGVEFAQKFSELKGSFKETLEKYNWYLTRAPLDNCPKPNSYFIGGVRFACQEYPNIMISEDAYKHLDMSDPRLAGLSKDDLDEQLRELQGGIIGYELVLARALPADISHVGVARVAGMLFFRKVRPLEEVFEKELRDDGFNEEYTSAAALAREQGLKDVERKTAIYNLIYPPKGATCRLTLEYLKDPFSACKNAILTLMVRDKLAWQEHGAPCRIGDTSSTAEERVLAWTKSSLMDTEAQKNLSEKDPEWRNWGSISKALFKQYQDFKCPPDTRIDPNQALRENLAVKKDTRDPTQPSTLEKSQRQRRPASGQDTFSPALPPAK